MKKTILFISLFVFLLHSCDLKNGALSNPKETLSKGKATFMIDESYKPIFESLEYLFEGQKPDANLTINYTPENEALNAFFSGKVKTIFVSRDCTKEEKRKLKNNHVHLFSDRMGYDAAVLLINEENVDSTITLDEIKDIYTGKVTKWKSSGKDISLIFDHENSGNFNKIRSLANNAMPAKNVFASKSTEETIKFVKENKNAIGVIGMSWISDEDDPKALAYMEGLKMMSVAKDKNSRYYQPYQADIFTKKYPLYRELWVLNRAGNNQLNSGFVNFCLLEKGQLVLLKGGLVTGYRQPRELRIRME